MRLHRFFAQIWFLMIITLHLDTRSLFTSRGLSHPQDSVRYVVLRRPFRRNRSRETHDSATRRYVYEPQPELTPGHSRSLALMFCTGQSPTRNANLAIGTNINSDAYRACPGENEPGIHTQARRLNQLVLYLAALETETANSKMAVLPQRAQMPYTEPQSLFFKRPSSP